ncbi:DUF5059 domain-containing protein [Natrinema limicola]|uniref:DUF5059 domain-containing protein n=1 Tax=Natrinema limicola TaxID=370323 RepID=UPI0006778F4C|nr:DUF5059 domain-containing protein [Natrinema limicola]
MQPSRRDLLAASTAAIAAGLAGCSASGEAEGNTTKTASQGTDEAETAEPVNAAVSAEWNAMRARLWDSLSLGIADETGAGASVAQQTFARFEHASGKYGALEMLDARGSDDNVQLQWIQCAGTWCCSVAS